MADGAERERDAGRDNRRLLTRAVIAIGLTQIISWGTTLYALGVLGKPISRDTGWSGVAVYGGLTIGLLVAAATSQMIGRLIDKRGGQPVMMVGAVLSAAGLVGVSLSPTLATYWACWAVVGLAMRMTLYDAAFAAIVQVAPSRGRVAISYLTLFGGLASSVFWPVGRELEVLYGWRTTLQVFAGINLFVALPLYWIGLNARETADAPSVKDAAQSGQFAAAPLTGAPRRMAIILFSVVMAASAFTFGAMAAHLPDLVQAAGVTAAVAAYLSSIKGVAQTVSRLVDLVFGRNLHPINLGRLTLAILPLSFLVWFFGGSGFWVAAAFSILFGITNGLTTIVRGAVPLALFGAKGYGEVLGILATPYLLLNAVAPLVFAWLVQVWGMTAAAAVLLATGMAAWIAMEVMAAWYRRSLSRASQN